MEAIYQGVLSKGLTFVPSLSLEHTLIIFEL